MHIRYEKTTFGRGSCVIEQSDMYDMSDMFLVITSSEITFEAGINRFKNKFVEFRVNN
jgi:hypothetical protein